MDHYHQAGETPDLSPAGPEVIVLRKQSIGWSEGWSTLGRLSEFIHFYKQTSRQGRMFIDNFFFTSVKLKCGSRFCCRKIIIRVKDSCERPTHRRPCCKFAALQGLHCLTMTAAQRWRMLQILVNAGGTPAFWYQNSHCWAALMSRLITGVAPHTSECDGIDTDNDVSNHSGNGGRFCFHYQRGAALAELIADWIQFMKNCLKSYSSAFCLPRWHTGGEMSLTKNMFAD